MKDDCLLSRLTKLAPDLTAGAGLKTMEYIAEIIQPLGLVDSELKEIQPIEVSLDCSFCQRNGRTVVFSEKRDFPRCISTRHTRHDFDGRFLDYFMEERNKVPSLVYRIRYSYSEFFDHKRKLPSVPQPTWARVGCIIACSNCGEELVLRTQNNISRSGSRGSRLCSCKSILFVYEAEDYEAPWFRLFDSNNNLLYEQFESSSSMFIYSEHLHDDVIKVFNEVTSMSANELIERISSAKPVYYQAKFVQKEETPLVFSQNFNRMVSSLIRTNTPFDVFDGGRSLKSYYMD